jgi:hypothetical protein
VSELLVRAWVLGVEWVDIRGMRETPVLLGAGGWLLMEINCGAAACGSGLHTGWGIFNVVF